MKELDAVAWQLKLNKQLEDGEGGAEEYEGAFRCWREVSKVLS